MATTSTLLLATLACVPEYDEGRTMQAGHVGDIETDSKALVRRCAEGPTVRGIDVSYYQRQPDWDRVAADGVRFAFIRVSDGLRHIDSEFERNWREARRAGIRRGAYQFFRPNLDPIAQADLLVDRMGALEPGDLPPVIDVEATGGLSPSGVRSRVRQWIDRVRTRTGVQPIIYTGSYFWRDQVGGPSWGTDHHLWVAHYTTGCPLVPEPWSRFTFHQYTDRGRVAGISGNVDMNNFNGTLAELDALTVDGVPPPPPPQCETIDANGRTLEEDDACVELGGPTNYLRRETSGHGGAHVWTGATSSSQTINFAAYTLTFDAATTFRIEAYAAGGTSQQARYEITHADGTAEVVVDQSAASGFVDLGVYTFDAGTPYAVRLGDNTGESSALGRRIVFDGLRVTPAPPDMNDPNVCHPLSAAGGVLEEDGPCATLGGPERYLRADSDGHGGGRVTTGATSSQSAANYVRWALGFEAAGRYRIEVYVDGATDGARWSRYRVTHAGGTDDVHVDHSTASGFVELGVFSFDAGGGYSVRLDDNTGESSSLRRRLTFDAVQATPVATAECARVGLRPGVGTLNVRPLPNTDRAPIGQLASSEEAERLATTAGSEVRGDTSWHRVRLGQTVGYISGSYARCL